MKSTEEHKSVVLRDESADQRGKQPQTTDSLSLDLHRPCCMHLETHPAHDEDFRRFLLRTFTITFNPLTPPLPPMGIKKLTLITLNKDKVEVETQGLQNVAQVKAAVAKNHAKDWPSEHLIRLIYNGRILQDGDKVDRIDTDKMVIILKLQPVKNPKDRRSASMSATTRSEKKSAPARMVRDSPRSEPARVLPIKRDERPVRDPSRGPSPVRRPAPPSSSSVSSASLQAASSFVIGKEFENTVQNIMSMGFGRSEVEKAMRMSYNNPNRATELLLSGAVIIEENMGDPPAPSPTTPQPPAISPHIAPFLKQLEGVKALAKVKGRPGLKQGLDEVAKKHPQAFAAVKKDEKGFLRWVNDEPPPEMTTSAFQHPPVATQLTEEDRRAITRISAMGFPVERAMDAYMMMGKNEAAAIELLLSTYHDRLDESHGNSSSSSGGPPPPK